MNNAYFSTLLAAFLLIAPLHAHAGKGDAEEQSWQAATEANLAAGYKAYLAEFPKGRYAATARIKLAILGEEKTPASVAASKSQATMTIKGEAPKAFPRPALPFVVSDEIWRTIEQSDYYKSNPARRGVEVTYSEVQSMDLGSMVVTTTSNIVKRAKSLPNASPSLMEFVTQFDMLTTNNAGGNPIRSNTATRQFLLGNHLELATLDQDGKLLTQIQRINELKGSLFPLKTGNELRINYEMAYVPDRKFDSTIEATCRIGERLDAATVNPALSGIAWQLSCRGSNRIAGNINPIQSDTLLIEQYGIVTEKLGFLDLSSKRWVVPSSSNYSYTWTVPGASTTFYRINGYTISPRE